LVLLRRTRNALQQLDNPIPLTVRGAGALGTLAALLGAKSEDPNERRRVRTIVPLALLVLTLPAAALDLLYYNRLLQGAVAVLLEFEKNHPEINMSTRIDEAAHGGKHVALFAYGWMILILALSSTWSWYANRQKA
jgi:hypothetical protein